MLKSKVLRDKRGVAGLNVFLGIIVTLFIIGFLVMIFSLVGGELRADIADGYSNSTYDENISFALVNGTNSLAATGLSQVDFDCGFTVGNINNGTEAGFLIDANNYTVAGCNIRCDDCYPYNDTWYVNGTLNGKLDNTASEIASNTSISLGTAINWFDIIIVIAAMVVLILLTVIIIRAIKGSGLVGEGA